MTNDKLDLNNLYQRTIIDYNKNPHNYREIGEASFVLKGHNPLCGDSYNIYLKTKDERIIDISFTGNGCAISKASCSILTDLLVGKKGKEAIGISNLFLDFMTRNSKRTKLPVELAIFDEVKKSPMRVKCATLAWHTIKNHLNDNK